MAPLFSMSRLWHHVSIPAEVDGFVISSPTWLPRFVHVFILSLSPSLSLFSFFSPPQGRSLSLPLFLSSLSSLPLRDGLSLSLSFSLLFLLSPSGTVSLSPSLSLSDRTNFMLNSRNYSKHGSGGGDRGGDSRRVRERRVRAAEGDSRC